MERLIGNCGCINPLAKIDLDASINEMIIHDQLKIKKIENKPEIDPSKRKLILLKDRLERIKLLREDIKKIPDC